MKTKRAITREYILDYLRSKKEELAFRYRVSKLALFGSYARGEETEDSDIDLLIDFQPNTPNLYDKKHEIRYYLSRNWVERSICVAKNT